MIYRFEGFELDEERFELRRGYDVLAIPRKSFELLRYLLLNAGRVVPKEELFSKIWPNEYVTDAVLPVSVRVIRKALGDGGSGTIVRTVRGRGYSILCPVEQVEAAPPPSPARVQAPVSTSVGLGWLMEQLKADFQSTATGRRSSITLLYGDAGFGKTHALDEFVLWARTQNAHVLQARCEQDPGAPPFWTLIQLLAASRDLLTGERLREATKLGYDDDRAAATLRSLLSDLVAGGPEPPRLRFRLARAMAQISKYITTVCPLVLVLDDMHLLDEGSLGVWEVMVRELRGQPLFTLGSYRDGELPSAHAFSRALGSLVAERGLRQIPLRGLDAGSIAEFVRAELGTEPSDSLVRGLLERTEGNPLFLRELLRLLPPADGHPLPGGDLDLSEVELPHGIFEVFERRLETLSAQCRTMLEWAAVIGRRFALPVLEQVSGFTGEELLRLLEEASRARIIGTEASQGMAARLPLGEYRFSHALIREAIYTRFNSPQRALQHRAVGLALERLQVNPSPEKLAELAHHFFQAAPAGEVDRAVDYSARAAGRALSIHAHEDAVKHLENALRGEQLRAPQDPLRVCSVTIGLANALLRAQRYDEAKPALLRAAELAREVNRPDLFTYAVLGLAKPLRWVGPYAVPRLPSTTSEDDERAVLGLAREAQAYLADKNPALTARLLALRVGAKVVRGRRLENVPALRERAVELARRSGDPRALFDALLSKRISLVVPHENNEALAVSDELVEVGRTMPGSQRLFAGYETRILTLLARGEMERVDQDIAALTNLATYLHEPRYDYAVARVRLARVIGDGRLEDAQEIHEKVVALGRRAGEAEGDWAQLLIGLWVAYARGRRDLQRSGLVPLAERATFKGVAQHALAAILWTAVGDRRRSTQHFEEAAAHDFADLPLNDDWLWHLSFCADLCAGVNDAKRARLLYDLMLPHASVNVTNSFYLYRGSTAYWLGRLALVLRDTNTAWAHFEAAMSFNRAIGAEPALLVAQFHYGVALQRGNTEERARGRNLIESAAKTAADRGLLGLQRAIQPGP